MSLSLATDLPVEYPPGAEPEDELAAAAEPSSELCPTAPLAVPAPAREKKAAEAAGPRQAPTGLQAVEVFVRNRQAGDMHFLYLNVAPRRHFRPYDLVVVPKRLADPEHYVFSSFGVLHVHPEEGSEALTLGAWHREAMLWQLMQHIPFFRLFLVRKAFVRWCCSMKHLQRLKHQEMLRCQLLQAVPHFGAALLQISRLLQELWTVPWLPHSTARCLNFAELQQGLAQENSGAQDLLSRFLTFCSSILELVREDTYQMVHGLQTQVQGQKLYVTKESLYQQRVESEGLRRRLQEAESWLQKLGFLALLVNFLICQNLVSIVQEAVTAFVSHTMQAEGTRRKAVIRVELVFGPEEQLGLFPSPQELEACLLGALDAVVESVLLVTRINSEAPRTPKQTHTAESDDENDLACLSAVQGKKDTASSGGQGCSEPPRRLPLERLSGEEPQLVYHLDLKVIGGLEVVGHRLRGQYPLLSREQLEKDLRSDSVVQRARARQQALLTAALLETQHLCHAYSWLAEIYRFAHSWGASQLGEMKGLPCEEYVNRIAKLRTWMSRVKQVPRSVVTTNRLLFVDCTGIHQDILPLLASINEDILSLLLKETAQRSELLIGEMSAVLQLYLNVSSDIFTIAKCSQKLEQYQGQLAELQESVDYVRSLNEVIQHCFRPLSPSEESLENSLLDTWEAFVYQQREVSDFIVSRRLSIIAELSSSLQKATRELQEILATVTVGRFRDPLQNPRAMEEELHRLLQHFQSTVVRVAELCRSQRILTGECLDVSFVTGNQGIIEVHVHIWQLFRIVSEQRRR